MKKKRLMPMCLCLVLALGLAACDDLEDLLPSSGDDETSEVSPTEPGDTGEDTEPADPEGPSESVPTYSIEIVYPDGDISLEVGDSETIAVSLVTTVDNTDSRVAGTDSEVTLYSSNPNVVSVEGLTITALTEGEAVITATWTEHDVTSSGLNVKVTAKQEEEHTYDYSLSINNSSEITALTYGGTATVGVSLTTITDGDSTNSSTIDGTFDTVKLETSDVSVLSVSETDLSVTVVGYGNATLTATWIEHEEASDSVSLTVEEPVAVFESYTITIQLKTSDGQAFPAPTGNTYSVFINSEYDMTSGGEGDDHWESWTTHIMEYDSGTDTYSYTYTSLPTTTETTHTAKFYASPSESESDIYWENGYLGEYEIPVTQNSVGAIESETIEITTPFTSWDDIFNPTTSEAKFTYVITFKHNGATLDAAGETISLSAHGNFDGTWDETNSWWDWGEGVTLTNNNDGTYNMALDFVPENGRFFEIYVDDTTNTEQYDYDSVLATYAISGLDQSLTENVKVAIDIEADYASFSELLNISSQTTYTTMNINIVTIDTGSTGGTLYITGGDSSGEYWNSHYTMSSIADTTFTQYGEAGNYYTFSNWDKTKELEFCIHGAAEGNYWTSCIQPTSDIDADSNSYKFWSSWNEKNGDYWSASYFGFVVPSIRNVNYITELTLVLSFDYSGISATDCVQLSMTYEFHVTH